MSTTNKAFHYVFHTRSEDHKIAKVLSGWRPIEHAPLSDLTIFDAQTREQIEEVQEHLFATSWKMTSPRFGVSRRVLDVLTANVLQHYPQLKKEHPGSLVVQRIEQCVLDSQSSLVDLLTWSTHVTASRSSPTRDTYTIQHARQSRRTNKG